MQKSLSILLISLLISSLTRQQEFSYRHPWMCIKMILFDVNYFSILSKIDDSECENNFIDLNTIFRDVTGNKESNHNVNKAEREKEFNGFIDTVSTKTKELSKTVYMMHQDSKKLEDEMRIPEDDFHNNILTNFSLDVDYTKRMNFNDPKVFFEGLSYNFPEYTIKKEEDKEGPSLDQLNKAHELDKKNINYKGNETEITSKYLDQKNLKESTDKFQKMVLNDGTLSEEEKEARRKEKLEMSKKNKEISDLKVFDLLNNMAQKRVKLETTHAIKEKYNSITYKREAEKEKFPAASKEESAIEESQDQNAANEDGDSDENDNDEDPNEKHKDDKHENDLRGYIEDTMLEERNIEDFVAMFPLERYSVNPVLPLKIFIPNDNKNFLNTHARTVFAMQTRMTSSAIGQSDNKKAVDVLKMFKSLPKCVQSALQQCNPDMQEVIDYCETNYNNRKDCSADKLTVRLKCKPNEEFINNACYRKCPLGYKDAKLYCIKSKVLRRSVVEYRGQTINPEKEEMWGEKFVVAKCSNFGKFYKALGSDYCRPFCPEGYRDSGVLCAKPVRYYNQIIFTYNEGFVHKK